MRTEETMKQYRDSLEANCYVNVNRIATATKKKKNCLISE